MFVQNVLYVKKADRCGGSIDKMVGFMALWLQVNLMKGVPPDSVNETCTAGAGSLLVEFGILSRLIGDSTFEWVARRAVRALWSLRSNETGLLGKEAICFWLVHIQS